MNNEDRVCKYCLHPHTGACDPTIVRAARALCEDEDARFLALIDRKVASGRRLYYRMQPKETC